jgi:hypothetical protein
MKLDTNVKRHGLVWKLEAVTRLLTTRLHSSRSSHQDFCSLFIFRSAIGLFEYLCSSHRCDCGWLFGSIAISSKYRDYEGSANAMVETVGPAMFQLRVYEQRLRHKLRSRVAMLR